MIIGNKTEHHVRTFFVNYRKRYNLVLVLKDFEKENGPITVYKEVKIIDADDISGTDKDSDVICLSPSPIKKDGKNNKIALAQAK